MKWNKSFNGSLLGKYFLLLIVINIVIFLLNGLLSYFRLPQSPTEANHLTSIQLLTGYVLTLFQIIAQMVNIVLIIVFNISLAMMVLRMIFRRSTKVKSAK